MVVGSVEASKAIGRPNDPNGSFHSRVGPSVEVVT